MSYVIDRWDDEGGDIGAVIASLAMSIERLLADEVMAKTEVARRVRVRVKRMRSALRLLARQTPGARARRAGQRWRDASRLLSELRDEAAAHVILGELESRHAGAFRAILTEERAEAGRRTADLEGRTAERLDDFRLAAVRARRTTPAAGGVSADMMKEALLKAYRRARRRFREATEGKMSEPAHEWRKEIRNLINQLRLARRLLPAARDEIDRLTVFADRIGRARDLEIAAERVDRGTDDAARAELAAGLRREASAIIADTIDLARPVFSMKATRWGCRLMSPDDDRDP